MKLLENEELQRMVDYSFGDQSGVLGGVPNAYMKKANFGNKEFLKSLKNPMTLFIDNIRLYWRPLDYSDWQHLKPISSEDRIWLEQFKDEDLLHLCSVLPHINFHIFTAFEDTPQDKFVWDAIPKNVLSINAANAVVFGGKVRPFPHGIERKTYEGYDHHEILREFIEKDIEPVKKLLICHRDDTGARGDIKGFFRGQDWATVAGHLEYRNYLEAIKNHKFVLCPSGNGIESARNWETLYMRRVPVFKRHPYLEEMFKDFPALFVEDFGEVTEELLEKHEHLYQQALEMDMEKLDLDYWFKKAIS
jgi:hypothetical protein